MSAFHSENTQFCVLSPYAKQELDMRGLLAKG